MTTPATPAPKNKGGRPRLSKDSATSPKSISFTDDELAAIDQARGNVQFATWVRAACRKALEGGDQAERVRELLEIAKLKGVSLKALAAAASRQAED